MLVILYYQLHERTPISFIEALFTSLIGRREATCMNNLTSALSTLTPPLSDTQRERRLVGSVVARAILTHGERDEMYGLLESYFEGTSRSQFEADLAEKESVIVLQDAESGRIHGFSTSMRISARI